MLPLLPHLSPTLLLSSSGRISFSFPNVPSFLSLLGLCPSGCSCLEPFSPFLWPGCYLSPLPSSSEKSPLSPSLPKCQPNTWIIQVGLSCMTEAASCCQMPFFSLFLVESFILVELMATQNRHGSQPPLQPDAAISLNSSLWNINRRASGKCALKDESTLPLPFFFPASWDANVMPGALAATFGSGNESYTLRMKWQQERKRLAI